MFGFDDVFFLNMVEDEAHYSKVKRAGIEFKKFYDEGRDINSTEVQGIVFDKCDLDPSTLSNTDLNIIYTEVKGY